ncbi:MAG: phosphate/phosphite/phosphonate ABC transporter substrate-binding protein [Proteobacteria bacterium]|nr:phosphate/phosphite/phosphonate ABC transporter substrate-binding protein [Pseudomonadota bacterium]
MKRTALILISLLTIFFSLISDRAIAAGPLRFGLYPYLSATKLVKKFSPLVDYLSREMGHPVELELAKSYQEHIRRMGKEDIDIAFMGPISYLQMTEQFGAKPILACLEIDGKATYHGVIAVKKGDLLHDLTSLKGKKFAFGAIDSTMGYYVALYMMKQAGLNVASLGSYESIENQENIALGVLTGDFDAGAMRESMFKVYEKEGLRALAISDPMPEHLFVAANRLGSEKAARLSKALQALKSSDKGKAILNALQGNLTGLVPATDQDYQGLRAIYRAVEDHE